MSIAVVTTKATNILNIKSGNSFMLDFVESGILDENSRNFSLAALSDIDSGILITTTLFCRFKPLSAPA